MAVDDGGMEQRRFRKAEEHQLARPGSAENVFIVTVHQQSKVTLYLQGDPEAAGAMFMFMIPPRPLCRILHPQNNHLPDILTLTSYRPRWLKQTRAKGRRKCKRQHLQAQ
ncbi:uncharacterized protein AAEQ78_019432 isoform 1-T1 [Lycaon pictus]